MVRVDGYKRTHGVPGKRAGSVRTDLTLSHLAKVSKSDQAVSLITQTVKAQGNGFNSKVPVRILNPACPPKVRL